MKDKSCLMCNFFNKEKWGICKAFPKGIPFVINSGAIFHDKPLPNQKNNIVFKPITKKKK